MVQLRQSVLMFHGLGSPRPGLPHDELPYWVSVSRFKDFVALLRTLSPDSVVWTFDDANASDMLAAEELAESGMVGKFFVLTSRLGRPGYLSEEDLRELDRMGMEVGSHGRDHIDWRSADNRTLHEEISGTQNILGDILGKPIQSIAVPFGYYNRTVFRHLKDSAYARIYTSDTGPSRSGDRFIRRNPVMSSHTISDVVRIIENRASLGRRIRRSVAPFLKRTFL